MRVVLVNPPDDLEAFLGAGANLVPNFEPLGLLYVAAAARAAGHDVTVVDAAAERLSREALDARLAAAAPQVLGLTVFTSNGGVVYDLGRRLKAAHPDLFVVLGNAHAAVFAEQYLRNGAADAVVHGEGEQAFVDLLRALAAGRRDFGDLPAVSWRAPDGSFVGHREEAVVADLDALPLPARDLVRQELYNMPPVSNHAFSGSDEAIGKHMFTSRGCPNRCTFCTVHHGRRQRFRGVGAVVDELALLKERYRASYVFIMDSLFVANKRRVLELCAAMRERRLDLPWGCEAHVRFIDEELVRAMAAAGCHDMAFGLESGVQRLLDAVQKNARVDQAGEAIGLVKRCSGIKVSGLFILGLPGETYDDSLETIRFATSLPLDMAQFSILTPYPGSALFEQLRAEGAIDTGVRPDGTVDPRAWLRYSSYISYTDNEPAWVTPGLTAAQLKALQKRALRAFYFRPRQFVAQLKRLRLRDLPMIVKTAFKTFF